MIIPEDVGLALSMLQKGGYEAYIIGGCVRDSLLGKEPKDYDITTSAQPAEVERIFKEYRVIETGIKHGTVTVLINGMPLEITTYRIDSEYTDNRRPDSVSYTQSLREDTARRDFTMNAVAVNEFGVIVDYHGGKTDIENRIIRCVGDPNKRFSEDALRILRAVRFASVLEFELDPKTRAAVFENKERLLGISSERTASELVKLLCGKGVRRVLLEYIDVIGVVIPELLAMKGFDQHNFHHIYDVLEHTAAAVEITPPEPILRLAALFHDIGKPLTFSMKDNIGHFYGHAKKSAELTDNILKRLKFDNYTRETVVTLVKLHDGVIEESEASVKKFMNKRTPEIFFLLLKLKRADNLAQAPEFHGRVKQLEHLEEIAHNILNEKECFSLKQLKIGGRELIELGFPQGPPIGKCLEKMLDEVISGNLKNEREPLLDYAKKELETLLI